MKNMLTLRQRMYSWPLKLLPLLNIFYNLLYSPLIDQFVNTMTLATLIVIIFNVNFDILKAYWAIRLFVFMIDSWIYLLVIFH
jgi:hypothetical protein